MKDACELLKEAQELIRDPEHWTKGAKARTVNDNAVCPTHSTAVQFCALGALCRVAGVDNICLGPDCLEEMSEETKEAKELLDKGASAVAHYTQVADVNDKYGHDAVMEMYDAARKDCK
jgi:hypothetical protein